MKNYLFVCVLSLLAFPTIANGQQTNLQLILEGPFAICELTSTSIPSLQIYVPNLEGTHYLAGFSSDLDGQYVPGDQADYPTYPDGGDFNMQITWKNGKPATLMALQPNDSRAHFYSEKVGCNPMAPLESFSVTVPEPDEVWALDPTDEAIYVTEHKYGLPTGPKACKAGCYYATKIVLHYLNVVAPVCLEKTGSLCKDSKGVWLIPKLDAAVGGEFQIELSAEPAEDTHDQNHAKAFFRLASNLAGMTRDLNYVSPPAPQHSSSRFPELHKVCQIPPVFFCDKASTTAACTNP